MTQLICIFGNSHMSAPAMSKLNAHFPARGDELRYWGLAGSSFEQFRYQDGRIVSPFPETTLRISGWCDHLDVAPIDTLVCYGFHFSASYVTRSILRVQHKHYGLSNAVRRALSQDMLDRWWDEQTGRRIIQAVRHDFPDKRMICYAHPHVAEGFDFYSGLDEDQAQSVQRQVLNYMDAKLSDQGVIFRRQPNETIVGELYTARAFNIGAIKYGSDAEQHDNNDFRHMNATYGDTILRDLLKVTDTSSKAAEPSNFLSSVSEQAL